MNSENKKEKERKHIVIYWMYMIVLFVVVLLSQQIVASIMTGSLSTSKYGQEAMFEILWAGLVLIIVLVFKNKYIFTQEHESFFKSFKYILPELLLSAFFVLISVISILDRSRTVDFYSIVNLMLYCLFIGIVEEFLCRGWLLNEFLERYSKNRKEIMLSIFFSSLIFGVVHFINIGSTQGFFETLVQVMNASAGGIFLALVYYKTKNIWVVVASHAIWDFSLFLSDANSLGDCLSGTATTPMIIVNIIRGIVLTIAYLCFCYWLYRQTNLYLKPVESQKDYLIGIGIFLYVVGLLFINYTPDDYYQCPKYGNKYIKTAYKTSQYHYDKYELTNSSLILESDKESGRLRLKDIISGESVYLTKDDNYYDYILVDNDKYYTILIQTELNVVLYGNYFKANVTRDKEYLKKVQDSMNTVVVPNIQGLGVLDIEGDGYHYPLLVTELNEYMYFNSEGNLYMNQE